MAKTGSKATGRGLLIAHFNVPVDPGRRLGVVGGAVADVVIACGISHHRSRRIAGTFGCKEIRMIECKEIPAIRLVLCCAIAAYGAGENFETPKAPAPVLKLAVTASTSSVAVVAFNTTTFVKVDPPPPVVPPGDRQQQG